jgi:polar amino acid transport system substrate-binding protein
MVRTRTALLLAGLLLLLAGPARASSLRLVTGTDFAPFADPSLPSGGLAGAVVLAAFAATDQPVEPLEFEPWKRGYADLLSAKVDAAFPYIRWPHRDGEVLYSEPIYEIVLVALFRAGSGHDYTGPDSLKDLSLCLPIGYGVSPPISDMIERKEIHVEQPATADICLKEVAEGRVDVFVGNTDMLDQRIAALFPAPTPFFRAPMPVNRHALHLIAARGNPGAAELIRRFNQGLAAIRADGRYDEIVRRQLGAS